MSTCISWMWGCGLKSKNPMGMCMSIEVEIINEDGESKILSESDLLSFIILDLKI